MKTSYTPPHLYIVGIGGVGTVWIADWALAQGWQVSGSDIQANPVTERLAADGAQIHYGVDPAAIPDGVTEAVVNAAITPISPSYPEYERLQALKVPIRKRAEWVGQLTKRMCTLAVCGAHGKTTTTAMLGWILAEAGLDPTVFVGGTLAAWGNRTRIGKSRYLVLEADEYDRSFHRFAPQGVAILNIDLDHTDTYPGGLPEIARAYRRFLRNLPTRREAVQAPLTRAVVVAYNQPLIRKVCRGFPYAFRWFDEHRSWPGLKLQVPGAHNLLNATAAAHLAHELGIPTATIKAALASFPGVGRRFEAMGSWGAATWYDDYAHHPAEVAATLQAVRARFGKETLTVAFQPHQKARTQALLAEFSRCFDANPPDHLILAPIYQVAGRDTGITIGSEDIAAGIAKAAPPGMEVSVPADGEALRSALLEATRTPGIVLTLGAGSLRNLAEQWRQS